MEDVIKRKDLLPNSGSFRKIWDKIRPVIYLLPAIVIFALFVIYPICYNVYLSFYEWNMVSPTKDYVGLNNYTKFLSSTLFKQAGLNTIGYILILLFFCFILPYFVSFILGLVIKKGSKFYRAVLFFPTLLSLAVAAVVFQWLFNSVNGPISIMLNAVGLKSPNWFQTPRYVVFAIGLLVAWRGFGYNLIIYLAAIVDVPRDLIEAAKLEGTSNWTLFWRIILPLTSPTALYVFIVTFSFSLQWIVTPINMLTGGGPNNASNSLVYAIYQYAFKFFQSGMAAAVAIITLIIFLTVIVIEKELEKKVHYEN